MITDLVLIRQVGDFIQIEKNGTISHLFGVCPYQRGIELLIIIGVIAPFCK